MTEPEALQKGGYIAVRRDNDVPSRRYQIVRVEDGAVVFRVRTSNEARDLCDRLRETTGAHVDERPMYE